MKKMVFGLALLTCVSADALDLNGSTGYFGEIVSVAPGFYGQVGIALSTGTTCNGKSQIVLRKDHTSFSQVYAALLAAVVSNSNVHFGPVIGNTIDANGFCLVDEAAIGRFPGWSTQ